MDNLQAPNNGTPAKKKGGSFMGFLWKLIFLVLVVGGVLGWWFYFKVYSDGLREGILIKFSKKGNVFKTYEGEIVQPGLRSMNAGAINTNNFFFSVIDKKIADSLDKVAGKSVKLHYNQYKKALPWRGDDYGNQNQEAGQYIIDSIVSVGDPVNTGL